MEPHRTLKLNRRAMLTGMALAALAPVACIGKHYARKDEIKPASKGRLVSAWENKVTYAPDRSRGGAVFPGLNCRVYLFGPDLAVPYIGDGMLRVTIFDASNKTGTTEGKMTDIVDISPDSLKLFTKRDIFGDGYTLFIPWFNYRPEISDVFILLEYVAANGEVFTHQSGTFTIDHAETKERARKGMPAYKPDKPE